jgi:hypothetical protein
VYQLCAETIAGRPEREKIHSLQLLSISCHIAVQTNISFAAPFLLSTVDKTTEKEKRKRKKRKKGK